MVEADTASCFSQGMPAEKRELSSSSQVQIGHPCSFPRMGKGVLNVRWLEQRKPRHRFHGKEEYATLRFPEVGRLVYLAGNGGAFTGIGGLGNSVSGLLQLALVPGEPVLHDLVCCALRSFRSLRIPPTAGFRMNIHEQGHGHFIDGFSSQDNSMKNATHELYLRFFMYLLLFLAISGCEKAALVQAAKNQPVVASPEIARGIDPETRARIEALERICAQDLATPPRGIAPLAERVRGSLLGGARSLALERHPSVAILTGFWIVKKVVVRPDGASRILGGASETDGPVGTAHLAAGLARAGIPVRVVTDENNAGAVRAALEEAGRGLEAAIPLEVAPWKLSDAPDPAGGILAGNTVQATAFLASLAQRWKSEGVTHVMSLERVGPARSDGLPHNMGGLDISAFTAPLHLLYESGGWTKLAVGDGGNEIGMGSLDRELIRKSITNGKGGIIASATPADYLQVCGVSNWGGPTFLFALALLRPEMAEKLLAGLTPERDKSVLQAVVEKGPSVDGIRGTREAAVDNLDWPVHGEVLRQLWSAYLGRETLLQSLPSGQQVDGSSVNY